MERVYCATGQKPLGRRLQMCHLL